MARLDPCTVIPPPDIDFGNVPTNLGFGGPTAFSSANAWGAVYSGVGLTTSNRDSFPLSGYAPNVQSGGFGWIVTFNPFALGPQRARITLNANFTPACAPNSFIARGVGVAP